MARGGHTATVVRANNVSLTVSNDVSPTVSLALAHAGPREHAVGQAGAHRPAAHGAWRAYGHRLSHCVKRCVSHCVSRTVSPTVSNAVSLTVTPSLVSLTVPPTASPTASPSLCLPLCLPLRLPHCVAHCVAVLRQVGGKLWVFGGEGADRRLKNDTHCLDVETMEWRHVAATGATLLKPLLNSKAPY